MRLASVRLLHALPDTELVLEVADALGRYGVVPWLDQDRLTLTSGSTHPAQEAAEEPPFTAAFLSPRGLGSATLSRELEQVLQAGRRPDARMRLLPVFLAEPLGLVRDYPLLAEHWLHPDGDRLQPGYVEAGAGGAETVARGIAELLYLHLDLGSARDVAVVLDQRGEGLRTGLPPGLPETVEQRHWPALVFRSDRGERAPDQILTGGDWRRFLAALKRGLGRAVGTRQPRGRRIHLFGQAQLALPYVVGRHFDRTSGVHLFAYDQRGRAVDVDLAELWQPLTGGDAWCAAEDAANGVPALAEGAVVPRVSLILATPTHLPRVTSHLAEAAPPVWVPTRFYDNSDDVLALARDLTALLQRLGREHGTPRRRPLYDLAVPRRTSPRRDADPCPGR